MKLSGRRRARVSRVRAQNHLIRDLVRDLKKLRDASGLNQEDFAELIGRHQSSVSRFESFDSYPRLDMIRDYAVALDHEVHFVIKPGPSEGAFTYKQRKEPDNTSAGRVQAIWTAEDERLVS